MNKVKKLLKKHKALLIRLAIYPLAVYAGYMGYNKLDKMYDQRLEQGCTMAMQLVLNPLLIPECEIYKGELTLKVFGGAQRFSVRTGEEVAE